MRITVRTVSAVLLILLAAGCSSVGETAAPDAENGSVPVPEEAAAEAETEDPYELITALTTEDFGGYTFSILGEIMRDHYESEELNGDALNDAVYKRNLDVGERYGVELTYDLRDWKTAPGIIRNTVSAGDGAYDLATATHLNLGGNLTGGHFLPWNDAEAVDMTRPYYVAAANRTYSIGTGTMLLFGDFMDSNINNCWVFVFNKKLTADYGLEDAALYQSVDDGKWTVDRFLSLVSDIYEDVDGGGERDQGDVYGFVTDIYGSVDSFSRTMGLSAISKDENNYPYLDFYGETTVDAYGTLYRIWYETTGIWGKYSAFAQTTGSFITDRAVFSNNLMITLYDDNMRSMESDYGILPYPKYFPEADHYSTYLDGTFSAQMLLVTLDAESVRRTGVITEALNAYSRQYVVPALYDNALKGKAARDPDSARMIDLVMAGREFSFDSFDESNFPLSPNRILRTNIGAGKNDITALYRSAEKTANKWIDKMVGQFEESYGG